jgi:hypothetical protein
MSGKSIFAIFLGDNIMPSAVDTSISQMQQAADDSARLQAASITVQTRIQTATTAAQTTNSASAAATETAKGVAQDTKQAERVACGPVGGLLGPPPTLHCGR